MKNWLKLWLIFLLCLFHFTEAIGHATKKRSHLKKRVHTVYVGSTPVQLIQYTKGRGKHFVHVHESETTAKRAALAFIKQHGGSLLTLKHNGKRNISFSLRHQHYEFDPNRIFTRAGIKASLRLNSHYSPAAEIEVKKLARAILRLLPPGKIIAVHNNKDYSMLSYVKDRHLSHDIRAMHRSKRQNHRNFYLVTRYSTYRRLKRLGFNVVLQAKRAQNDGSLSIYLSRRDYVNVEAAYDAFRKQLRMLKYA